MKKPIPNSVCDDCINAECVWRAPSWGIDPPVMDCPDKETPPTTNADCIRAMTDEELAHLLHSAEEHLFTGNLWNYEKWTEWLKQEAT